MPHLPDREGIALAVLSRGDLDLARQITAKFMAALLAGGAVDTTASA